MVQSQDSPADPVVEKTASRKKRKRSDRLKEIDSDILAIQKESAIEVKADDSLFFIDTGAGGEWTICMWLSGTHLRFCL